MEFTAIHEAGHAWAYHRANKPLRYVTIHPREPGVSGACRPWKPRRIDIVLFAQIAAAGPIAEAMWAMNHDVDNVGNWEFDDYLTGAVLSGGCDDLQHALGMLDSSDVVEFLRAQIETDWLKVERVANQLMEAGTVSGRDAFKEFSRG